MKKAIIFFCCILTIATSAVFPAAASYNDEIDLDAEIALLVSLDNGTVIFDKNAEKRTAPASLTKITTAIVAIENCADLGNTIVTAPYDAIHALDGTGSSLVGIKEGEQISMLNLLYCMMVHSANESANIIADYIGGGSIPRFVALMNSFVQKLGCKNTHFVNAHGLDEEGQYTTASDLRKIVEYALRLPVFEKITNTAKFTLPKSNLREAQTLRTTNELIDSTSKYYYAGAKGIKTGTTTNAGRCVISVASRDGYRYLGIVLRAPYKDAEGNIIKGKEGSAFADCRKMFNWAFDHLKLETVADPAQIVSEVAVKLSFQTDYVRLLPKGEVRALVPQGLDAAGVMIVPDEKMPKSIDAPVKKGEVVGQANILYAGQVIGTVDLVAEKAARRSLILYVGNLLKKGIQSTMGKVIFAAAALVILFVLLVNVLYYYKKKKTRIRVVRGYRNTKRKK